MAARDEMTVERFEEMKTQLRRERSVLDRMERVLRSVVNGDYADAHRTTQEMEWDLLALRTEAGQRWREDDDTQEIIYADQLMKEAV